MRTLICALFLSAIAFGQGIGGNAGIGGTAGIGGGVGAPSLRQSASNATGNANCTNGGTTCIATFGSSVNAGNGLLVCFGSKSATLNTPTMTGETFTAIAGTSTNTTYWNCYSESSAVGGQTAVTGSVTVANQMQIQIFEITGQVSGGMIDQVGDAFNAGPYTVSTSSPTTHANNLNLGFFYDYSTDVTATAGSGYTIVQQSHDGTNGNSALSEQQTVSTTGTQTATATGYGTDLVFQTIISIK